MHCLQRSLNFVIFIISVLLLLLPSDLQNDPSLEHLHSTLANFLSRGQAFVENLPPLSLLLAAKCSPSILGYLSIVARGLKVVQLLWGLLHSSVNYVTGWYFHVGFSVVALGFGLRYIDGAPETSALLVARSFADACLMFAATACLIPDALPHWSQIILPEIAMALALLLGCNRIHWISVLLCLGIYRLNYFFERFADNNKSVWYHFGVAGCHALLQFSCIFIVISIVLSQTYSFSEKSAGGNWNLRYLSAATRRSLRSGHKPYTLPLFKEKTSTPRYGIVPGTPVSLYLQGAGFLYTDDQIWDESIAAFHSTHESEEQAYEQSSASARAIFIDSIRYTEPWSFEQVLNLDETSSNGNLNNMAVNDYLCSGSRLRVRSQSTGKYLAIEPGTLSIVDRLSWLNVSKMLETGEDGIRWTVSTSAESQNMSSLWTLMYKPHQIPSFRLRNSLGNCYLATSYRSFPDWDAIHGNDTVLQGLHKELEVTCLTDVTLAASTLDIVDGYREFGLIPETASLGGVIDYLTKNISYQFEIIMAMINLYDFRKKHTALQDVPTFLISNNNFATSFSHTRYEITILVLGISITFRIYCIIRLQRSSKTKQVYIKSFQNSVISKTISLLLVVTHLIWYYILNFSIADQEGVILAIANLLLAN